MGKPTFLENRFSPAFHQGKTRCFPGRIVPPGFPHGKTWCFAVVVPLRAPTGKHQVFPWCFPGLFLENTRNLPGAIPTFQQNTKFSPGVYLGKSWGLPADGPSHSPAFPLVKTRCLPGFPTSFLVYLVFTRCLPGESLENRSSPGFPLVKTRFHPFP